MGSPKLVMAIIPMSNSGSTIATTTITNASSDTIWVAWNQHITLADATTTSYVTASGQTIWTSWNATYVDLATTAISAATTAVTTASTDVWVAWNNILSMPIHQSQAQSYSPYARQTRKPTEAEVKEQLRREQEYRAAEEKRARERKEANDRAELLLMRHLTPEQKEDLFKRNAFVIEIGKDRYEIRRGRSGNVRLLDQAGKERRSFCIHPEIDCPDADTMLAQKLLLETDRRRFYEIANVTEYEGGRRMLYAPNGAQLLNN
jgi:hypothetical protein